MRKIYYKSLAPDDNRKLLNGQLHQALFILYCFAKVDFRSEIEAHYILREENIEFDIANRLILHIRKR